MGIVAFYEDGSSKEFDNLEEMLKRDKKPIAYKTDSAIFYRLGDEFYLVAGEHQTNYRPFQDNYAVFFD